MRKVTAVFALALVVLGGVVYGGWRARAASDATEVPATENVSRATLRQTILATGVIGAENLVSVGAQVGGQIQSLPVHLGQRLKAGDLVAQIDPEEQQTDLLRAEAALAQIEAQILALKATIAEAEATLNRKQALSERGLTANQDLEPAVAQLEISRANLKATEAQRAQAALSVQSARIALERTRITAPSDGTVVALVVREGQTINAIQSSPTVIKLAQLDTMVVKTEISEADVINVRPGQSATFTLAGAPDRRFEAVLRTIEPAPSSIATADEVDTKSAIYYNALLDVPNPEGILRIGMSAEVTIILAEAPDALTVPAAALALDEQGQRIVRVWDPLTASISARVVEIGLLTTQEAQVLSGLTEGESIVTNGRANGAARSRNAPFSFF